MQEAEAWKFLRKAAAAVLLLRLKNFVVREVNIVLDYINVFPTFNDDLESLWNEINCVDIVRDRED